MKNHKFTHAWRRRCAVFAVLAVLVVTCGLRASIAAQTNDYIIGENDVLNISVWEQPGMSGRFIVEADGTFTFLLIGRIQAGGLTLRGLEEDLARRLAKGYLKNPQVRISIEQYHSQRIFVVGEVRQPGAVTLSGEISLLEALARAGSVTENAGREVMVVSAPKGQAPDAPILPEQAEASTIVRVNLASLQSGTATQSVVVQNGDTIYVPRGEPVYVLGEVNRPGSFPVPRETTVLQALSLAGGVSERGASGRVKVIRVVNGTTKELRVKLTDLVQPGDTIVVPQRFF